jgi:hypothetical protein
MMSSGDKSKIAKTSIGWSPRWCAYAVSIAAPEPENRILHFKGFIGGVPLNTETAAVNPRAGIE